MVTKYTFSELKAAKRLQDNINHIKNLACNHSEKQPCAENAITEGLLNLHKLEWELFIEEPIQDVRQLTACMFQDEKKFNSVKNTRWSLIENLAKRSHNE